MPDPKIAIVDYQAGNLRSVQKAMERFGARPLITSDPNGIESAGALVFPGQGACDSAMRHLRERGLVEPLKAFIRSGRPFLGVCLGLQLLLEGSDEGDEPGLGVFPGWVRRLPGGGTGAGDGGANGGLKIPHMGWNQVRIATPHPLLEGVPDGSEFYFVHSYYADPADPSVVAGTTDYGIEFCSIAARDNVFAVQFHPEKSGELGLRIYENFIRLVSSARAGAVWR